MNDRFQFAILGCGGRGNYFSQLIQMHPEVGTVAAVADPDRARRDRVGDRHGVPAEMRLEKWEDLLGRPRLADVVVDTLMDQLHAPSAIKAFGRGYHVLLEKPMATTLEECIAIDEARRRSGKICSVCHSMRYHATYQEIKRLLDSGAIGRLVSFEQLEGVEAIHQSHSFVRGNWGNESRSAFMLMTKSCHDVDVLTWLVGKKCRRVSSFGSRSFFNRENAPAGAPLRCTDGCPAEEACMYSAMKIYLPQDSMWARHARIEGSTEERLASLKHGPYGRCVFHADNDVVDHQVVSFEYEEDVTGTFTMTAFAPAGRHVRLHGTQGMLKGDIDARTIETFRFGDGSRQEIKLPLAEGGHGGADEQVLLNLWQALKSNDPRLVLTGTDESLMTHRIVFAAETARREGRVVEVA
jgi:predicted dehydrogenase